MAAVGVCSCIALAILHCTKEIFGVHDVFKNSFVSVFEVRLQNMIKIVKRL